VDFETSLFKGGKELFFTRQWQAKQGHSVWHGVCVLNFEEIKSFQQ
jgi:hypothetical protein